MASYQAGESIAHVYAEALYDVTAEQGQVVQIEQELQVLAQALSAEPRLLRFLETPTVSLEDKRKVLSSALKGVSKPILNLMLLAIDHGRIGLFGAIVNAYHRHANDKAGIAEVDVSSARTLDEHEIERLKTMLSAKLKRKIALKPQVRPELLGGMVVLHGGRAWDASLSHRLERIVEKVEEVKATAKIVY